MKNLFLLCLFVLTAFSQIIQFRNSKNEKDATGAPVLYWATDMNPTRQRTVNLFRAWLKTNHYPDIDLRVDAQNGKLEKILVQGVSGVGPDIFNLFGWDMQYLYQVGLIAELDPLMKDLPLPREHHDPTVSNDLYVDGKRIAFSQNAGTSYYFVNRTYLRSIGMPMPPERWDLDAFEAYGKEFYQKANKNRKDNLKSFLVNTVDRETFRRSAGVSVFNETMTSCVLNQSEHVALLKRLYKWTYEDHVIPSAADSTMFSVDQGRGGGNYQQLFHKGYMPLFWSGLPILIQLRDLTPPVDIGIAESPSAGFRNSVTRTFSTALYPGKRNMHLARYF
ncbi:MAG: extracellular solute-binding protein, partial [Spirochaetia bacterium]|nr:extracellular solute-binding protein [Spirochaetia bacterium]